MARSIRPSFRPRVIRCTPSPCSRTAGFSLAANWKTYSLAFGATWHRGWFQVNWPAYNSGNGRTFPAAGDLDGDGRAEIVTGLGAGSGGWIEVFEDSAAGFAHAAWLRPSWSAYTGTSGGETHPAVGNIDGDTHAEIVVGLGEFAGAGGWIETFDDAVAGYASLGWRQIVWLAFNAAGGATRPAVGRFR
jgi:hypothetical protein